MATKTFRSRQLLMVILLNGSFGVGKTTVARSVQRALRGAILFDPERIGYVLQRLPRWLSPRGSGTGDFQDVPVWRTLTVHGIRLARQVRPTVIVPMTFSNLAYLDEVRTGICSFEPDVRHFCLVAPAEVVQQRVQARGDNPAGSWMRRRIAECCQAHGQPEFGEHIPTAGRAVAEVVGDILGRLGRSDTVNAVGI